MRSSGLGTIALPLRFSGDLPIEAPMETGVWAHGWFFRRLAELAPEAGDALHTGGADRRPFALGPLLDGPDGPVTQRLLPGAVTWLRLGFLDAAIHNLWQQAIWPALLDAPDVQLGPLSFTVAGPPLIDLRAWESLLTESAPDAWWVSFLSPTVFKPLRVQTSYGRTPERFLPLPDPATLLTSLGRLWTRFAPPDLKQVAEGERVTDLIAHIQLDAARVETVPLPQRLSVPLGFTGDIVLLCLGGRDGPRADDARRQLLSVLMQMARVSGAGSKTARGLGLLHTAPAVARDG